MALREDDPLRDLEAQLRREDPQLARALATGSPVRRRESWAAAAWLPIALIGAVLIGSGVVLAQGGLLFAGLLLVGIATYLFCDTPDQGSTAGRSRRPPP